MAPPRASEENRQEEFTVLNRNLLYLKSMASIGKSLLLGIVMLSLVFGGSGAAAASSARERTLQEPAGEAALSPSSAGTIAYVAQNGTEIWLVEPDGSNKRRMWSMPSPDPEGGNAITGLAWRPDAGALAFASTHEKYCSWYHADIYTIAADGSRLRRVTNAPNCAELAGYPKGTVTATIQNSTLSSGMIGVYVQGSQQLQVISISPFSSAQVTFQNVADLGDVVQPVTAIYGGYRFYGTAYANVLPGQTVDAGILTLTGPGLWHMGAYKANWRADGARIGYTTTACTGMRQISPTPIDGAIGEPILNTDEIISCAMAWGRTPARANQVLYSVNHSWEDDVDGIYLAAVGSSSAGERLVALEDFEGQSIHDIQWLADGSGFLFTKQHVDFGIMSDIFEYRFSTKSETRITNFGDEEYALNFSISPDGQQIVFELAREFEGPTDLYIIGRDGKNMRLLAANAGHPAWSPSALLVPEYQNLYLPVLLR
jgi:hypothetical protein